MWFNFLYCAIVSQVIAYSIKEIESKGYRQSRNILEEPPTSNELPCLSIGGYCLNIDICPVERRSFVKGLCPMQEHQGIECCDLRSILGEACAKERGKYTSRYADCQEKLTFFEGGDCSINEKCC